MITSTHQAHKRRRKTFAKSYRRPIILLLLAVGSGIALFGSSQQAKEGRRDSATVVPPSEDSRRSRVPRTSQNSDRRIADGAARQIQALIAEKESRTAAQRKIDSQLLYAMKMRRGESITTAVQTLTVDVGADAAGSLTVDITALIDDQLLRRLESMRVQVSNVFPQYHSLRAKTSLDQLETIAGFPQVRFIQPKQGVTYYQSPERSPSPSYPPGDFEGFRKRAERVRGAVKQALATPIAPDTSLKIGIATSEGDTTHKAFSARGTFNTDGTGIKIGVLSDGVLSLATSQSTGDLGPVTVLAGQAGSGDEGTAMLEIIHDLAPGAQLFFATADGGIANFAQNIRNLRSAGCDIILDDVGYFVESAFQDGQTPSVISTNNGGLATQAVNDVVASGALYFSAAANSGNKNDGTSGTWEGDFVDGGTLSAVPGGKVHDFDPSGAIAQFDTITASGFLVNLHWSDSLGGSANDYDLFVLDSTGATVIASSTNIQNGTQDPYEQVFAASLNERVVILQKTGAANRFLHLSTNRGELSFNTQGETHGHNAASGAYGAAAVCAVCTFPSVFSSTNTVETFSSDGPRRVFFNGNSTAITPGDFSSTGGTVLQKPDVTAADGVSVSGAGGFPTTFYGTSAAAPHAAAIAALLKSANPPLTPAQIRTALTSTAIDIEAPGTDRDSGVGIIMPYAALQSLGPPVVGKAFLELSTISLTETSGNGNGVIDPGESGALNIVLNNTGLLDATGINATLSTSTSGVTIVSGSSLYPDLSASGGSGANTAPFSISLSPSFPPDSKINFTLMINYTGGHNPSQSCDFSVLIGMNGSFETGDFAGWNVSAVSTGGSGTPFQPWSVSSACSGGFPAFGITTTSPQAGVFDAWNGFDGGGPMEFRMYQDVTVPTGAMVNLSWKDRAQWNFCCGATVARTYNVQLRDTTTNAVLTNLYTFSTGTDAGYHDTGWLSHSSDLSAYIGQQVRIYFLEVIPQNFTGPAQIEFDAIRLSDGPAPTPTPIPSPSPGLYGATRAGQLFTINLSNGAGSFVGTLPGCLGSTEIEYDDITHHAFTQFPDGIFEGQEFDINTGAGISSLISDAGSFTGLEWVGSSLYGTMVTASHGPSQLRILNPSTGNSTLVGSTGIVDPIAGLAYDTGVMYGLTGGANGGSSNLVTVNLTTGAATVIGPVGLNGGSLEFGPDGNLYAGSVGGTGNLYRINKATGASTLIGATGFINVTGLTLVNAAPPTSLRIDTVISPVGRTSGGQQIILNGAFAGLSTVTMGGAAASFIYTNGGGDTTKITVTTPAHSVGAVDIVLTPSSGSPLTRTNGFAYLPTVFTDDTITVGQTTAKAQHILELRQAVDAMRAVAGLSGAPWSDPALAPGNTIRAVHITELRTFLDDAATRLGFSTSPYTEPGLTAGFVIKRIHIEELRQRIRTIAG